MTRPAARYVPFLARALVRAGALATIVCVAGATVSARRNDSSPIRDRAGAESAMTQADDIRRTGSRDGLQDAATLYDRAVAYWRTTGERALEGETLLRLADVLRRLDRLPASESAARQALETCRVVSNGGCEAEALRAVGAALYMAGDVAGAVSPLEQAARIQRDRQDLRGEALALGVLMAAYSSTGELQRAIETGARALELRRQIGDREGEARAVQNLGAVYGDAGDYRQALAFHQQALALKRTSGDRHGEGLALLNIGVDHAGLGDLARAVTHERDALPLLEESGDNNALATALGNIAEYELALGRPADAETTSRRALETARRIGDAFVELVASRHLGSASLALGRPAEAVTALAAAVAIARNTGNRTQELFALYDLARAYRAAGDPSRALEITDRSIDLVEQLRRTILDATQRATFFATRRFVYELRIAVLMELEAAHPEANYARRGFEASERSRARSLLDLVQESRVSLDAHVDRALVERQQALLDRLADRPSAQPPAEAAELERDLRAVRSALRRSHPQYVALTEPPSLDVEHLQRELLDQDTMLVEYSLGEQRSFVWVVGADVFRVFELGPAADLERAARTAAAALARPRGDARAELDDLAQRLIAPIAALLGDRRLVIVAEGALQYVPFAALPDPRHAGATLLDHHELVSLPSASTIAALRQETAFRRPATHTLAIVADPVLNGADPRVSRATPGHVTASDTTARTGASELDGLERLPFARVEAERIAALLPSGDVTLALGFDAERARFTTGFDDHRIVHVASHALVDASRPERTGLVLSMVDAGGRPQPGFVSLPDVFNMRLRADLVVLSACQTALGDDVRGEGLVGLARAFMYAGAQRVVASLWRVPDRATAELMTRFYRGMLERGLAPAAALRDAQLAVRKDPRWRSPFYWAGFGLQGEWRPR